MSATIQHTRSEIVAPSGHTPLAGTATLVRFMLRRDRIKLPAWTGGLGLFAMYLIGAIPVIAETEEDLAGTSQLFGDPVGRLLVGPGYGFDAPTYARFIANGYGLYFFIIAALMSILVVTRHTRLDEQAGRSELVLANVVGRHAPLTATVIVATITNLIGGIIVAALMVTVGGFAVAGSLLFAASVAAVGLTFTGITTITVQLSEFPRAAAGMAGGVLGAAFVLRAGGDMAAMGGSALSWTSPLGWGQQTAPYVLDRWWPIGLLVALAVATAAIAYVLAGRRDLGASFLSVRPGRAQASSRLGTPLGLAGRLQRASIIGWTAALAITGLAYGAYADALLVAIEDMPDIFREMFGAESLLAGYLAYMATFMAYLASAYTVMAIQGVRSEETSGRGEPLLSTPMSRAVWLGSHLVVAAAGVVIIMLVAGLATGLGAALVTGNASHLGDLALAHLNQVPAVLVVLGVATALFGVLPRALPAAWFLVGFSFFTGTFGQMLELPSWLAGLSPFDHLAEMPIESFAVTPVLALVAIAGGLTLVGLAGLRHRDIHST